jgi:RNA polymerase sigma-70 factor (ECF subfamily)
VVPPPNPDPRSDQDLVRALNAGDTSAFDAIYYRYQDWVLRLAHRFTGHGDDSLDVLQETFSYLFRKFPGFVLTASMTTFLYPVVKNLSIAARRKRTRQPQLPEDGSRPDPAAPVGIDYAAGRAELRAVLSALPEAQREVLLMRFVDGMSLIEIAEVLGVPEGTVKSRIHNAIATLRKDERTVDYFRPD